MSDLSSPFRDKVRSAAEAALRAEGAVGPLEVLRSMFYLQPAHFDAWLKGKDSHGTLEAFIQVGPEKFQKTMRHFQDWVREKNLVPMEAPYQTRTLAGAKTLQVTAGGDPERERFFTTRYVPAALSEKKAAQLNRKLTKAPDLVVFQKVSEDGNCSECNAELPERSLVVMENGKLLCLECADLDHLVFLPSGDAALSRRSKKHSPLSAVVVRFIRSRKRYERQGILVTEQALRKAEEECAADAPERQAKRAEAAIERREEDREFVTTVTEELLKQYPGCPANEARAIAEHACVRGSGRVGRSAAARALDPNALRLALWAHVRHEHTNYDSLLMNGTARSDARDKVRGKIESVVERWSKSPVIAPL